MLGSPVIKACRDLGIQIKPRVLSSVDKPQSWHSKSSSIQWQWHLTFLQHVNKVPAHYQCFVSWKLLLPQYTLRTPKMCSVSLKRLSWRSQAFTFKIYRISVSKSVCRWSRGGRLLSEIIYASVCQRCWSGSVSRSGWGAGSLLCMNRGLPSLVAAALDISCQPHRQADSRGEGGGDEERRWQRTAPRRAAPFTGDVSPILRRRKTLRPVSAHRNGSD